MMNMVNIVSSSKGEIVFYIDVRSVEFARVYWCEVWRALGELGLFWSPRAWALACQAYVSILAR